MLTNYDTSNDPMIHKDTKIHKSGSQRLKGGRKGDLVLMGIEFQCGMRKMFWNGQC